MSDPQVILNMVQEFIDRYYGAGKLRFRDGEIYIYSSADGHLNIIGDVVVNIGAPLGMANNYIEFGYLNQCRVYTAARATPLEGDLKWDDSAHKLQVYNGSAWETVNSA